MIFTRRINLVIILGKQDRIISERLVLLLAPNNKGLSISPSKIVTFPFLHGEIIIIIIEIWAIRLNLDDRQILHLVFDQKAKFW